MECGSQSGQLPVLMTFALQEDIPHPDPGLQKKRETHNTEQLTGHNFHHSATALLPRRARTARSRPGATGQEDRSVSRVPVPLSFRIFCKMEMFCESEGGEADHVYIDLDIFNCVY